MIPGDLACRMPSENRVVPHSAVLVIAVAVDRCDQIRSTLWLVRTGELRRDPPWVAPESWVAVVSSLSTQEESHDPG